MRLLLDPNVFSYIIMALYVLNAARWAWEGRWVDVAYWLSALAITVSVVLMSRHSP